MPSQTYSTLVQDWKYPRTAKGFTGHQGEKNSQSTILRCVTNSKIPCNAAELALMGKTRFSVTVLSVAQVGFAYAPNKKSAAGYVKMPNTKHLFEELKSEEAITGVKMYAFKKASSSMDRGERDDSFCDVIHVGQDLTFWVHDFMFTPKDNKKTNEPQFVFPTDIPVIQEFTVIDMKIMSSHNEGERKGYGIKLQKITVHPTSLYSYLTNASLKTLPATYEESTRLAEERMRESPFIQNQLEVKNTAFFAKAPQNTFVNVTPVCEGMHRLFGPEGAEIFPGIPCIDVATTDLLKFANVLSDADDIESAVASAITMVDFASAAHALYLYVIAVPQFKSKTANPNLGDFRGVPLIDADELLKAVKFEARTEAMEEETELEPQVKFPFPFEIVGLDKLAITVSTSPVSNSSGLPAPCLDFSLMAEACQLTKGYVVTIGSEQDQEILRFCFNVMGCQLTPHGAPLRLAYSSRKRKAEN